MEAFKPSPALAPYVTDIWAWEIPASAQLGASAALTLLPDGFPTFCLVYGDALNAVHGKQAWTMRSAICGFQARPMQISCGGFAAGLTVRFVPWGLACFMPGSLEEAAHRRLDCRDVFARSTVEDLESALFRDAQEIFGITPEAVKAPPPSEVAQGFEALGRGTALASTIFR